MKVKAYVDGSYNEQRHTYGGGVVILGVPGVDTPIQAKANGNNTDFISYRNITGEILAVLKAMEIISAIKGIEEIEFYHDYLGIAYWVTGEWQARKKLSRWYRDAMLKYQKDFKITFHHVKGHSGDYYNGVADTLAREATKENINNA